MQRAGRGRLAQDILRSGQGALGFVRLRTMASRGRAAGRSGLHRQGGMGPDLLLDRERLLGLERLERAQRAPELGHRRAAIAQQGLERARAVAVAWPPERGWGPVPHPGGQAGRARARRPRCGAPRTAPLQCGPPARDATRRPRPAGRARPAARRPAPAPRPAPPRDRRTRRRPRPAARDAAARACRASAHSAPTCALPSSVFGPRDFAPFRRLASARALLIWTAARGDCPVGWGAGPQPRWIGQSNTGHGWIPWAGDGGWLVRARGSGQLSRQPAILAQSQEYCPWRARRPANARLRPGGSPVQQDRFLQESRHVAIRDHDRL